MKLLSKIFLFSLFLFIGIFACVSDNSNDSTDEKSNPLPENVAQMVIGKWELREGYRNGIKTETLADTYFSFMDDGKMQTNLGGGNELVDYSIDERTITHGSQNFPVDYAIEEIGDSTMTISMTMRDIPFKFVLGRAIEEMEEAQ